MWAELILLLASVAFLLVTGRLHRGFGQQPHVALAGTPARFAAAVERAGGTSAVRAGLWLDLIFIVLFGLSATLLLHEADATWGLPLIAAGMDLLENLLIGVLTRRASALGTWTLAAVAVLKFALYLLTLVELVRRVRW